MPVKPESYGEVRQFTTILFGDNEHGKIIDQRSTVSRDGIDLIPFLISPSPHMAKRYEDLLKNPNLQWVSTKFGDAVWMEYPSELVDDSQFDLTNPWVRVECNFDGTGNRRTDQLNRYLAEIRHLKRTVDRLKFEVANLEEENASYRQKLADKMKEMSELFDIMGGGKSEEDKDDYEGND